MRSFVRLSMYSTRYEQALYTLQLHIMSIKSLSEAISMSDDVNDHVWLQQLVPDLLMLYYMTFYNLPDDIS